jgi:hypothetical protein
LTQLIFLKEYPYSNVTSIRIQGVVPWPWKLKRRLHFYSWNPLS